MFIDEVTIDVQAGDGGDGSAAMRREKFRPLGGPAGGDGGDGGDIVLLAQSRLTTLADLDGRKHLRARRGEHGRGNDQYGRGGDDVVVHVPVGTLAFDAGTGELLADLNEPEQRCVVAQGGKGGRGNLHFVTPTDRAPKRADPGRPGERRKLRLELKLLADVGIIGFPNVGKSTLIARVSRARPRIADYPFTTLVPNLGVVSRGHDRSFVLADIPGLVEGAAEGAGLGHRFLKHVERCRVLLELISVDPTPDRTPESDHATLRRELERFDAALATRPFLVAFSKIDLPHAREAYEACTTAMRDQNIQVLGFSAATGEGIDALLDAIERLLQENPIAVAPRSAPLPRPPHRRAP